MRMWLVDPKHMCRNHLLGEHLECHMFLGAMLHGKNLAGYINNGLLDVRCLKSRHEELAVEMRRRGYRHSSILDIPDYLERTVKYWGNIDKVASEKGLHGRCNQCFKGAKHEQR